MTFKQIFDLLEIDDVCRELAIDVDAIEWDLSIPNKLGKRLIHRMNSDELHFRGADMLEDVSYLAHHGISVQKILDRHQALVEREACWHNRNFLTFLDCWCRYYHAWKDCRLDGHDGTIPLSVCRQGYEAVCDFVYGYIQGAYLKKQQKGAKKICSELAALTRQIGGYVFHVPNDADEICAEAKEMQNCMAARLDQYCRGEWAYVFMRRVDAPDVPFVDLIISRLDGDAKWLIYKGHKDIHGDDLSAAASYISKIREEGLLPTPYFTDGLERLIMRDSDKLSDPDLMGAYAS